jgi:predicted nucleotidyltransferase
VVAIVRAPAAHDLAGIAARLRGALERAGAVQAIVFGSYARGTEDAFSDLDLAVVLETELPRLERHRALPELFEASPVGLDLLVYTPEEFRRGCEGRYDVFDRICREGVTIYERGSRPV